MRSRKALLNIAASLLLQFTSIICGFIIPRLIIGTYGSSVNGVISSITQFLGYISLLEGGLAGVIRATLYKPLANKDIVSISRILKSTDKFFKTIAYVFIGYLLVISVLLPYLVNSNFNYIFTFSLVLIIGVGTFAQYFFGITYQILLQSDQRLYVTSTLQIITTIANTIIVFIFIKLGASIHIVKICSSVIFIFRPLLLNLYVKRKYKIIKNCMTDNNLLKQKWDGIAHHIAYFLHNNTDVVVLTIFTNIKEVSVYSVYLMVVAGIRNITTTFSSGIEAAFGNMIVKDEKKALNKNFNIFEFFSFFIVTVIFTSATLLIVPFISVYTKGITDANYYRPLFAYILLGAEATYCIRLPYHSVITAAGNFKQTKNAAFIEAIINIILSVILVNFFGIVGVAIGTLCAMIFRTIYNVFYLQKNILKRSIGIFFKKVFVCAIKVIITVTICRKIPVMIINTYTQWLVYACKITSITILITIGIDCIFYFKDIKKILDLIKRILIKSKPKEKII